MLFITGTLRNLPGLQLVGRGKWPLLYRSAQGRREAAAHLPAGGSSPRAPASARPRAAPARLENAPAPAPAPAPPAAGDRSRRRRRTLLWLVMLMSVAVDGSGRPLSAGSCVRSKGLLRGGDRWFCVILVRCADVSVLRGCCRCRCCTQRMQ